MELVIEGKGRLGVRASRFPWLLSVPSVFQFAILLFLISL
jgi:hypothetical protein